MQDKSEEYSEFTERTDRLAEKIGLGISDLPAKIGISTSMFYVYRTGKNSISKKVWSKLEAAEMEIGGSKPPVHHPQIDPAPTRMIPVLGWAHAGDAGNYEEIPASWQERVPTECRDPKAFAVRLEGDSMAPAYLEGDLLIVQPSLEIYNGCLAVIRMNSDGYVFRRIEIRKDFLRLIPLNPQWPAEELPSSEISWAYPLYGMWRQVWKG